MARYCGSCGTEVDETAVFCPTCGQPIDEGEAPDLPPAPAWPEPTETDPEGRSAPEAGRGAFDAGPEEAPTRVEQRPPPIDAEERLAEPRSDSQPGPEAPRAASPPPPATAPRPGPGRRADSGRRTALGSPQIDLPLTMPVTLSGWLIGIGAALAVLGLIVILVVSALNVIDLLLLLALLGVAATVFLSAQLPAVPHLRLMTLIIALIAFGVALDRVGFRGGGAGELLLFLGSASAAIGAVILELGQDQPLGGPQR